MTREDEAPIVIYEDANHAVEVRLDIDEDTVWLSLSQIATVFGRDKSVISRHLKNVFENHELERDSVVAKNATTAADGKTYQVEYFNLDAIISVGYRVNSSRATHPLPPMGHSLTARTSDARLDPEPPVLRNQRPRTRSGTGAGAATCCIS